MQTQVQIPFGNFKESYEIVKQLGQGTFAKVIQAIDLEKSQNCAVKQIYIQKYMLDEVSNEVSNLQRLNNQHIIEYSQSFYDQMDINLNLVMEICKGSLRKLLQHKQFFIMEKLRSFIVQMTSAFLELQRKNTMHLDLKPQNILIVNQQGTYFKLCDFGCSQLANCSKMSGYSSNVFGTFNYLAPEIHLNYKGKIARSSADMWSLGVIVYEMIFWKLPFNLDENRLSKRQDISNFFAGKFNINFEVMQGGPVKIIEILKKMLTRDPIERLTWRKLRTQLKQKLFSRQFQFSDIKQTINIVNENLQIFIKVIKTTESLMVDNQIAFAKSNKDLIDNFYCSFVNYIYHLTKYYQVTQKYRFHSQNLNSGSRIKFNKSLNTIESYLKNICQAKAITIQFNMEVVKEIEKDFQEEMKQFKLKLLDVKIQSMELKFLLDFSQEIQYLLSKNICFFSGKDLFIKSIKYK